MRLQLFSFDLKKNRVRERERKRERERGKKRGKKREREREREREDLFPGGLVCGGKNISI